ncbi:hypothetical protein ACJEBK_19805 [Peribacillus frigoritolerans]|uniref:hypothetical protein n=1 Tax=Peribacillus frigoritolerans TaxID=450367 RepID=UPI003870F47F
MREWTTDEIIYIIYKQGGVIQLGKEEKFADIHFKPETYENAGISREEVIDTFIKANQVLLEVIENYYAMGLTLAEVLQTEAAQFGMTVEELLRPIYDKESLH